MQTTRKNIFWFRHAKGVGQVFLQVWGGKRRKLLKPQKQIRLLCAMKEEKAHQTYSSENMQLKLSNKTVTTILLHINTFDNPERMHKKGGKNWNQMTKTFSRELFTFLVDKNHENCWFLDEKFFHFSTVSGFEVHDDFFNSTTAGASVFLFYAGTVSSEAHEWCAF